MSRCVRCFIVGLGWMTDCEGRVEGFYGFTTRSQAKTRHLVLSDKIRHSQPKECVRSGDQSIAGRLSFDFRR